MKLDRPIIFFDLETTGIDVKTDRIVEIATVKLDPDGTKKVHTRLVNPGMPIPIEASNVHGITDDKVKDEKTFAEIAQGIFTYFQGCDLAGYNMINYDLPLLKAEFSRVGFDYDTSEVKLADMMQIYHKKVKRDLTAAYRYYTGEVLKNAHSAKADILATEAIFHAQLKEHEELSDMNSIHEFSTKKDVRFIDSDGKFRWNDKNEAVVGFGKNRDKLLKEVAEQDSSFLEWIIRSDFPDETKKICRNAILGTFPERNKE